MYIYFLNSLQPSLLVQTLPKFYLHMLDLLPLHEMHTYSKMASKAKEPNEEAELVQGKHFEGVTFAPSLAQV